MNLVILEKTPLLKTGSNFKPISWDEAFHTLERVFHPSLNKFKEDDLVIFSSNQMTLEEAYLLEKLASYVGTKQVKFDAANNPSLIANPSLNGMISDVESFENWEHTQFDGSWSVPTVKKAVVLNASKTEEQMVSVEINTKHDGSKSKGNHRLLITNYSQENNNFGFHNKIL